MTSEILTAIVSAAGAVIAAVAGYVFTKRAEREAEWRRERLERPALLQMVTEGGPNPQEALS